MWYLDWTFQTGLISSIIDTCNKPSTFTWIEMKLYHIISLRNCTNCVKLHFSHVNYSQTYNVGRPPRYKWFINPIDYSYYSYRQL